MVKKTLVLGVSSNPDRYSNMAVRRLASNEFEVIAIGLKHGKINEINIENNLIEFKDVHTVTLYLNQKRQKEYYSYIISLKPKRVIFNPGTENSEFYKLLEKESIGYMEACTLVLLSTNQY
ncbi:MAG: CoA-binding protein [Cryomorphaceae bacterium BACL29 MAG-121220-bin8]|jgi:predicted CoA-binding protein|nr:MAG: CoA-binding protein [Cryomorphaceae bacterium BACL29 MAG-121220-bin8]|tara:strand:- start:86756 stop:87118 length:363 start_codon:yes stop_codon:yes gene_type:complete